MKPAMVRQARRFLRATPSPEATSLSARCRRTAGRGHDQHAAHGLEIIGVSVDAEGTEETIRGFQKDFAMTYPIWLDPDERVQTLYMALGVPASYLIDREGVLRWKHLGTVRATDTTFTRALDAALGGAATD